MKYSFIMVTLLLVMLSMVYGCITINQAPPTTTASPATTLPPATTTPPSTTTTPPANPTPPTSLPPLPPPPFTTLPPTLTLPPFTSIPIVEDCNSFSWATTEAKKISGRWKVVDGSQWLLDFNTSEVEAKIASDIIKYYHMDQQCFVGRPNAPMMYFLAGGNAPGGTFGGEDCINLNPASTVAKNVGGNWKVVDGSVWLMDFGANEGDARTAVAIIKKYDFIRMCFVGRPNPPMMYFHK